MLVEPQDDDRLGNLERRLQGAETIAAEVVSDVMKNACVRLVALPAASKAGLNRLIEAEAWTDAALSLLQLELPQWKLRRLIIDDGQWYCLLSKQPLLPIGHDEVAEATHESLPLAILLAFVQARRMSPQSATHTSTVPAVRPVAENGESVMCCDNFS